MIIDAPVRCEACAQRTHADWLSALRAGDVVLVRNGAIHFRAEITAATPCYLFVKKLKFHRSSGWMVRPKGRLRLRLVRTQEELR